MSEETAKKSGGKPVASFKVRGSGVEVALWQNGDNVNLSLSNSYKAEDGSYKDTTSFSVLDAIALQQLVGLAVAKGVEIQQQNRGASRPAS